MSGRVEALYIGPEDGGPISAVDELRADAGKGIVGDRYYGNGVADEEITLIESEAIAAARQLAEDDFTNEDTRRNVVTSGIRLEPLVGRTFKVGEVTIEGLGKNPSCKHLERVTGKKIMKPLLHVEGGAGIRGRIVTGGTIRAGDAVEDSD
jgi:MOSC domain-containing protein YiiM